MTLPTSRHGSGQPRATGNEAADLILQRFRDERAWMARLTALPGASATLLAARAAGSFLHLLPARERITAQRHPTVAALGLLKELGPVVTALLFAGRAGTALTSEIGLMRVTDQLTAMEIMAVDPMRYVVAPRFLGGLIAVPLLVAIFDMVGLFGAQLVGVHMMGVDAGSFWSQTQGAVAFHDVIEGIIKSVVFGAACSLIAVYEGYNVDPTAEGVALATTRTVVASSVLTLLFDYTLTAIFLKS